MSYKADIKREPVPADKVHRFKDWLLEMSFMYEIRQYPQCNHAIEMLIETLERVEFETLYVGSKNKGDNKVREYIAIFKNKYLMCYDRDYSRKIEGVEIKVIQSVIKKLEENYMTAADYLAWIFDEFLPENNTFNPIPIKTSVSSFVFEKFLFDQKDNIVKQKEIKMKQDRENSVMQRVRILIRTIPTENKEFSNTIKDLLSKLAERVITIDKLDEEIVKYEKSLIEGEKNERGKDLR